MNLVNTPEARRALAVLALLDNESGRLKRLGLPTRSAVSAINSFCVTVDDLAVFPLTNIPAPAREELANAREPRPGVARAVPMTGAAASEQSAAGEPSAAAARSSSRGRSAKPDGRSIPPVAAPSAVFTRSNDQHSKTPSRQISGGSTVSSDDGMLAAEARISDSVTQQVKDIHRADRTIGGPMDALSNLVHQIEAKRAHGKRSRRDIEANPPQPRTALTRPEPTAERQTEPSIVTPNQPSALKSSGKIQSSGNRIERRSAASSTHYPFSDVGNNAFLRFFTKLETETETEISEESKVVEESEKYDPDQKGAGRSLPFSSSASFPVGQRILGEFQDSAAGSDACDPGEQLADLINAALQAQARRRGIS